MFAYSVMVKSEGIGLYTAILLPEKDGRFPVVIRRTPYINADAEVENSALLERLGKENRALIDAGYAVIFQHCRGCGKSEGSFVPYIHEREDGLALLDYIRASDFYMGELYFSGSSYTSSVFYVLAPFSPDVKGAVFRVQDTERYNVIYRNGVFKTGLHGGWYLKNYKSREHALKMNEDDAFHSLPLSGVTQASLGERADDFEEVILHPDRSDAFWRETRFGGAEASGATVNADFPMLLVTGFYDIYTGGIFDMWNAMSGKTRRQSALLVTPYDHSMNGRGEKEPILFPDGTTQRFGNYDVAFFDHIRKGTPSPVEIGKVTYYRLFENRWATDDFAPPEKTREIKLGTGARSYIYDPTDPTRFPAGVSGNFGGAAWQREPDFRHDVISFTTPAFSSDTFVKGKMSARIAVSSDAEDTCFYVRVSLVKAEGTFGLRDDIMPLSSVSPDYKPGEKVFLDFSFDEHAFLICAGESLRIDIASAADGLFLRHTNTRGLYSLQSETRTARNTVYADESTLTIRTE